MFGTSYCGVAPYLMGGLTGLPYRVTYGSWSFAGLMTGGTVLGLVVRGIREAVVTSPISTTVVSLVREVAFNTHAGRVLSMLVL